MSIGSVIKSERVKIKYSQDKLGKYLNMTQQAVGKWEKNIAEPDSDALKKMSTLFNVSIDYLLGKEQDVEMIKRLEQLPIKQGQPFYVELFNLCEKMTKFQCAQLLGYAYGLLEQKSN